LETSDSPEHYPEVVKDANGADCFRGQDLISLIIPDNIHLRFRSRSNDWVIVKDGDVEGTLDKRAIGAEDGRLLDAIVQTNGPELGARFLDEFTRMSIAACTSLGFTTGIDDEDLPEETIEAINAANAKASDEVNAELEKFGANGKNYEARPGRTPRETMEENIMQMLDKGKEEAGEFARDELNKSGSTNAACQHGDFRCSWFHGQPHHDGCIHRTSKGSWKALGTWIR
jgi:DNA-directed RNA polymerase subunit A'